MMVDNTTGECIMDGGPGTITVYKNEEEKRIRNAMMREKHPDYTKSGKANPLYRKNGVFTWCVFDKEKLLFPEVSNVNLPRLMLLSTYMDYDNMLGTESGRSMRRKDLMALLGFTDRSVQKFVTDLVACDMMRHEGKLYWLGDNCFCKGHIPINKKRKLLDNGKMIKRLYVNGIRSLVDGVGIDNMKKLYYIFRIMPYVNRNFNMVCYNPLQGSLNLVYPMEYKDIAVTLGCGRNNAQRMLDIMTEPTLTVKKDDEFVTEKAVEVVDLGGDEKYLFINPALYYGGNDPRYVGMAMNYYRGLSK